MPEGLTFFIAAVLSISAPLTGWIAFRRDRPAVAWFVFGALSGPLALAVLFVAPPGRCPRCDTTVNGWPAACTTCGRPFGGAAAASRAVGPAASPEFGPTASAEMGTAASPEIRPAGSATTARVARPPVHVAPSAPGRRNPVARRRSPRSAEGPSLDAGPARPGADPWVLEVPAGSPTLTLLPSPAERVAGSDIGQEPAASEPTGLWPRLVAQTAHDQRTVPATPQQPGDDDQPTRSDGPADGLQMVASGIFTGGSVRLEIGLRYGICRDGPDLVILGPVDRTPNQVQAVLPIDEIDLLSIDDRVTVARAGGHDRLAMAFISAAGLRGRALEEALADVTARERADAASPAPR